jgi:hypothetical protein
MLGNKRLMRRWDEELLRTPLRGWRRGNCGTRLNIIDGPCVVHMVTIPGTILALNWGKVCTSFGFANHHDLSFLLALL